MANTLTPEQRAEADRLYAACQQAQTLLWDTSLKLEKLIGCAVDTTEDLEDWTLDYFIEKDDAI